MTRVPFGEFSSTSVYFFGAASGVVYSVTDTRVPSGSVVSSHFTPWIG